MGEARRQVGSPAGLVARDRGDHHRPHVRHGEGISLLATTKLTPTDLTIQSPSGRSVHDARRGQLGP